LKEVVNHNDSPQLKWLSVLHESRTEYLLEYIERDSLHWCIKMSFVILFTPQVLRHNHHYEWDFFSLMILIYFLKKCSWLWWMCKIWFYVL
jgi:hypothetical protein